MFATIGSLYVVRTRDRNGEPLSRWPGRDGARDVPVVTLGAGTSVPAPFGPTSA